MGPLLTGFWQRYRGIDQQANALKVLQLDSGASLSRVKVAYRRLAAEHHPDRGGDSRCFIEVRKAFEVLAHYA